MTYDLFMLLILAAATAFGAWKGLAWQVASIASIVLSYFVAYSFRTPLAAALPAQAPWNMFLAMLILFIGTSIAVWTVFGIVRKTIDQVKLKDFDRHIGAVFGFIKGGILCVIITMFALMLLSPAQQQAICDSNSGYYIAAFIDKIHVALPHEVHDVLHPYLDPMQEKIKQQRGVQVNAAPPGTLNPFQQPYPQQQYPAQQYPPPQYSPQPQYPQGQYQNQYPVQQDPYITIHFPPGVTPPSQYAQPQTQYPSATTGNYGPNYSTPYQGGYPPASIPSSGYGPNYQPNSQPNSTFPFNYDFRAPSTAEALLEATKRLLNNSNSGQ